MNFSSRPENSFVKTETGAAFTDATKALRTLAPHGHEAFVAYAVEMAKLHSDKNASYAAGGDALGNFKRVSEMLALYPNLFVKAGPAHVCVMYLLKQFDNILWSLANDMPVNMDHIKDLAVYFTILQCILMDESSE